MPGRNRGSGDHSRVKTAETRQLHSCSGSVGQRLRVGSEDPHVALGARVPLWPETVALGTHGGSLQPCSLVERSCGLVLVGAGFYPLGLQLKGRPVDSARPGGTSLWLAVGPAQLCLKPWPLVSLSFLIPCSFLPQGWCVLAASGTVSLRFGWGSSNHHLRNMVSEQSGAQAGTRGRRCGPGTVTLCWPAVGQSSALPQAPPPPRAYLAGDQLEKEDSFKFPRRPPVWRISLCCQNPFLINSTTTRMF